MRHAIPTKPSVKFLAQKWADASQIDRLRVGCECHKLTKKFFRSIINAKEIAGCDGPALPRMLILERKPPTA